VSREASHIGFYDADGDLFTHFMSRKTLFYEYKMQPVPATDRLWTTKQASAIILPVLI
jgi:hypothetical protein